MSNLTRAPKTEKAWGIRNRQGVLLMETIRRTRQQCVNDFCPLYQPTNGYSAEERRALGCTVHKLEIRDVC